MKIDIRQLSEDLAADLTLSDYDFWRALKLIEDELFEIDRTGGPIPMKILQQRSILRRARRMRSARRGG